MSIHDTEDRPYGEWMKAGFQGRAEALRTNQQSLRRQGEPNVQTNTTPKRSMNTRAIHGSVQVEFVPNPELTHRNRFLVMKTHHRPTGVVELAGFRSDPVSSSGGSGTRMNLDSLMNTDKEMVKF